MPIQDLHDVERRYEELTYKMSAPEAPTPTRR